MKVRESKLNTLESAYKILQEICDCDDLYDELLDEGFQPGTAAGSLGEIIGHLKGEQQ